MINFRLNLNLGKCSHLSNSRGGWNKREGGAKVAKSINVEGDFFFKISDFREMRITSFKKCIDTKF